MVRSSYPLGYRFQPTDVELVMYYLKRKVLGKKFHSNVVVISTIDIYKYEPWDLPAKSCLNSGVLKWYFFCPRDRKYGTGQRMNRATQQGYWKTTGNDRPVKYNDQVVGKIRTLVFYVGRPPMGNRTVWVMHEHRLQEKDLTERGVVQDAYVLCEIYKKDGPGPRNGAQYGAPFIEEEWAHDEENTVALDPSAGPSIASSVLPSDPNKTVASSSDPCKMLWMGSFSNQHPSKTLTSFDVALPPPPFIFTNGPTSQILQIPYYEVIPVMAAFIGEDDIIPDEDNNENVNSHTFEGNAEVISPEENGIYNHLEAPENMDFMNIRGGWRADHAPNQMLLSDDQSPFLELADLLDLSDDDVNSQTSDGISEVLSPEETGIYHHFPELGFMDQLNSFGDIFGRWRADHAPDQVFSSDDQLSYLELDDLESPLEVPDYLFRWAISDGFYAEPQFFPNYQQFNDSAADSSSVILNLPAPSESSVLQLVRPPGFQDPIFLEEGDGLREIPRDEHENSEADSSDMGEVLSNESEPGDECTQQSSRRGKLITTSRLQSLLESVNAYPVSAMELAPLKEEKRIEGDVLLYGGSSIDVKAEVTHKDGGSTEDALSKILEESPLTFYYESSYSSSWSVIFAFNLDIYFCFVWFLICGVVTNLSDCWLDLHSDLCHVFSSTYR